MHKEDLQLREQSDVWDRAAEQIRVCLKTRQGGQAADVGNRARDLIDRGDSAIGWSEMARKSANVRPYRRSSDVSFDTSGNVPEKMLICRCA